MLTQNPRWFQDLKKRTIPNHLVPKRKPGFQDATGKTDESKTSKKYSTDQYNLFGFGLSQKKALTFTSSLDIYDTTAGNETVNETVLEDDFPFSNNNDDLPPSRSIYDLNDEVLISLNTPASQNTDSFINKDPKSFINVFGTTDESQNASEKKPAPVSSGDSAILVFGYPETMANQVIAHFLELGTVLEEFEVNRNHKNNSSLFDQAKKTIVPIFSGESWVKITYDNANSAFDALQENGTVFNGVLLGVIPYTKHAVEKLLKRKLDLSEDIGAGVELGAKSEKTSKIDDNSDLQGSYIKRLEIQDGSQLFLKANSDPKNPEKKNDEKLSLWGKSTRFLFGFNEL